MRIPASHDYTRYYISLVGLDSALRPFISSHGNPNGFYYLRGKVCRIKDFAASGLLDSYCLSAQERAVASGLVAPAILGLHFDNTRLSFDDLDRSSLFGERFLTDRVAELERQSLGEYFERRLATSDARELIGVTTGLEVWWDKAVSMFIRDEILQTGAGLQEIAGGTDLLPSRLAQKLLDRVFRFNTEVISMDLVANGVRLRLRSTQTDKWDAPPLLDAEIQELTADYVICTIPFGVLRRMSLTGLSADKMRAIRNLNYAASTKVLLHCTERFWELGNDDTRIIGGSSHSDEITRATYYPSDHAGPARATFAEEVGRARFGGLHSSFSLAKVQAVAKVQAAAEQEGPGPGVLVGSYNWGRDARRLGVLSCNERAQAVTDVLEKFHPTLRHYVNDHASISWQDYQWSRGAFCFMQPGDLRHYYHAAIRPEGRLHFAGEHCSLDQAWIQGAMVSGLRAVDEIVRQ
jgi:monoamine oxidase